MKKLMSVQGNDRGHWVGDGFPVRTLFFYQDLGKEMSPFLMLDFAGPMQFPVTTERKGVGSHPHRGFETVHSSTRAKSSTKTLLVKVESLVRVRCNG